MKFAPIALFVYNRPEHTRQTVEALLRNPLAGQSELFIFSDAAKTAETQDRVEQVRAYVRTIDGFKSVKVIEREKNFGLANSIIDGVTKLCDDYGKVIVLEDDLVVAPTFLDYMNDALTRYQDEEKVMQISGYMFPIKTYLKDDTLFLSLTTSWGWATWQRSWKLLDKDARGYELVKNDRELRKRFDLDGAYPYYDMLESQFRNKVDSWAIRWYLTVFLAKGLVLYPRSSLVANKGSDGSGTHSDRFSDGIDTPAGISIHQFSSDIYSHDTARQEIVKLLRKRKSAIRALYAKVCSICINTLSRGVN